MAEKLPLVYVDGQLSQLPTGDVAEGASLGSITAGSGLVGGGDLQTGNKRLDVALASSASGVIFVGDSIGMDGTDLVIASAALASGVAGSSNSAIALASGVAAQSDANTALASGNAALDLAVNFSSSSSVELTASSVIQAGNPVGLDDAGKASVITEVLSAETRSYSTPAVASSTQSDSITSVFDPDTNQIILITKYDSNNHLYYKVGTISSNTVTWGTEAVIQASSCSIFKYDSCYDTTSNKVVIAYKKNDTSTGVARVGTVSGTTITWGSEQQFSSTNVGSEHSITYDSTADAVVINFYDIGATATACSIAGTLSGTTITFGTKSSYGGSNSDQYASVYDPDTSRTLTFYRDGGSSYYGLYCVQSVSGTTVTNGTPATFHSDNTYQMGVTYDTNSQRVVVCHPTSFGNGVCSVGTVTGGATNSISFGSQAIFLSTTTQYVAAAFDSTNNKVLLGFQDNNNSSRASACVGTVAGSAITYSSEVQVSTDAILRTNMVYDPDVARNVFVFQNTTDSTVDFSLGSPAASTLPTLGGVNNFIGTANSTVASGEAVTINVPRSIGYNNTGLSTGYFYYVDPTTSGYTTASGEPSTWTADPSFPWGPIAKAVSSSGLLILDTI
jgi:hypothetical protein